MPFSRRTLRIAFGACASLALAAATGDAARAQAQIANAAPVARPVLLATTPMNERVVVRAPMVTLGDLFAGLKDRTDEAVAPAPAPGSQAVYDLQRLADVARSHSVAWQPRTWSDRVVVERASRTVGQADIEDALRKALQRRGLNGRADIEMTSKSPQIQLAADAPGAIQISQLDYEERSGRFTATLAVDDVRQPVSGRAFAMAEVPVLNRRVTTGEVLRNEDIEWTTVRADQVNRQTITDTAQLVGREAKRGLNAGQAVRLADLRSPLAVLKNGIVTMMLQTPRMQLTSKGKAMEDASVGDTVHVMNSQSKTVVEGVVTSMNVVQITSSAPVSN
ncbi:MAG TPA: flagellar basal body P-ring formation chaperone FlgA [Alphaproteobacteria bacterium]